MIRFRKNGSRNSIRSYSIHYLWIFIYLNVCREAQGTLFPAGQYRIRDFSKVSDAGKAGKWKHRLLWKESTSCHESFVFRDKSPLFFRGGYNSNVTSTSNDDANSNTSTSTTSAEQDEEIRPESTPENCETDIKLEMTGKQCGKRTQMRHTSDMLRNLIERSAVVVQESVSLRDLIYQRSQDYLADLKTKETKAIDTGKIQKFPHPKKVLHYLAPKIPAIKHSPDVNLRIHTARFDIDSGIAACLIGTVAQVCEKYDNSILLQNRLQEKEDNGNTDDPISAANDLVNDRRFEQLIECLVCGVNVKQRKLEHMSMELKWSDAALKETNDKDDIHDLMEGNQLQVREGLNIRDACRAAWGLAILGAHHRESLGGVHIMDLLLALSLRVRELLLSRVQIFFQGDLMEEITSLTAEGKKAGFSQQAPQQHLNDLAEELAEDSAAAMWAFACVRACTGLRSDPLFETCCSILCRNPADLRKQALEREDAEPTVVINDVVDRLAYSESQIEGEHPAAEANKTNSNKEGWTETGTIAGKLTGSDEKEALIDWLSPNELTDVLWALALHGHSNETTRGENLLSENGNALKDIAFDRLIVLLREDFLVLETQRKKEVKREKDAEDNLAHSTAKYVTNEGETMTVEVVDAAALLASENASKATFVTPVENMTTRAALSANGDGGLLISGVEEAEFVDAATIIRSSGEEIEQRETMAAAQEVVIDADGEQTAHMNDIFSDDQDSVVSTLSERQIVADKTVEDNEELSDTPDAETWTTTAELLYFSPHDLCSLAWAVTELRDSLRFQTVHLVINIFSRLGEESFDTLGGADLSNLAWAMARQLNDARPWTSEASNPSTLQLMLWIVRRALVASGGSDAALNSHNIHILDPFQPPELSRLMWAVATGMRIFADESKVHFPDVEDLAINALLAASSNLSLFSPEDLVRIFWAFLELCDMDEALSYPHAAVAVGRVFSFIESFILRWEQGMCAPKEEELEDGDKGGGFSGITAFFLRPRLSRHMLDQIIEEYDDVEEEDDRILQLLDFKKSRRLPRLRDLAVDPSSLAKAAGGFAKLSVKHPNIRGSSTLTRVILKLLSSKNGRLLQEFSVGNLIRACEAAAINFSVDRSLDPVVGQFVRRFLHLLNDSNDPQNSNSGNFRKDLKLSSMSPPEISKLLWSLGELGARHLRTDKDSASAHRKLRFVMDGAMLTDDQLDHLSSSATMKVLHGLVAMNEMRCNKNIIIRLLELVEPKISSMQDESELCELAECLGRIQQYHSNVRFRSNEVAMNATDTMNATQTVNATAGNGPAIEQNTPSTKYNTEAIDNNTKPETASDVLYNVTSRMLSSLATHAATRVSNLKANSLCRLLIVYCLLPFQADDLINACEEEISKREELLASASSTASVEDLLRRAAENALAANATIFGKDEYSSSTLKALKRGLKSIFSPSIESGNKDEGEAAEEMRNFTEEVGGLLNKVSRSVTQVDKCLEQIGTASNVHTDTALQQIMEGANFELGRCLELIDNYRRNEFSTGRRKSRYDYERGRHIGKRLLSRLVPH